MAAFWAHQAPSLASPRRLERRIELPIDHNYVSLPAGLICVGVPIRDDYFYVHGWGSADACVFTETGTQWIGVTTGRGTVVVCGTATMRTKWHPSYFRTVMQPHFYDLGVAMVKDSFAVMCDPCLSRIHVAEYLTQEPDDDGAFVIAVTVHGFPVPNRDQLYVVNCGVRPDESGNPVNFWFLSCGIARQTIVEPTAFFGMRPDNFNMYYMSYLNPRQFFLDDTDDRWIKLRGWVLILPATHNPCVGGSSGGPDPPQLDCTTLPLSSLCVGICPETYSHCHYIFSPNGTWTLVYDMCMHIPSQCHCDYNDEELTRIFCESYGRLPVYPDYLFMPCCTERITL